jgi:LmbE family N-acetylglucosaminyl deacetylase
MDDDAVPVLGSILGVWAHPDDEAYLSAGLMAAAVEAGHHVCCVTATRGELGFPDDDRRGHDERIALRTAELEACLAELGVSDHRWLDHPDGGCHAVDVEEVVPHLASLVDDLRPDVVLTFGPDGGTWHTDHIAAGRWATLAVRRSTHRPRLLYAAKTPEWIEQFSAVVDPSAVLMAEGPLPPTVPAVQLAVQTPLPDELADRKVRALRMQASQVEPLIALAGADDYRRLMRWEFFREPTAGDWPE